MSWQGVHGHDGIVERFRRAKQRGRLAGSFLFIGPPGIGKRLFALALAKGYLCKGNGPEELDPCGHCDSCRLFFGDEPSANESDGPATTHPDLYYVSKPADKSLLPLELLIGDKDHRGRSGLCYNIYRTPYLGHGKVAIIDDADFMNMEGANALLKTLEEPPPDALLILIGTSSNKQLPTIRSRCQIIRFAPLSVQFLGSLLLDRGIVATQEQGLKLARRAGGSFDLAQELYDDSGDEIRGELEKQLLKAGLDSVALAARINEHVDAAGKDAPTRRRRLRGICYLAIDLFRSKIRKMEAVSPEDESAGLREQHLGEARLASRRLERTLETLEQIDRNAQLPFIVDAWCHEMK